MRPGHLAAAFTFSALAAAPASAPAQTTSRVSLSNAGLQLDGSWISAPSLTANARFVAFSSDASNAVAGDTNGATDVFVRDRSSGRTVRVSVSSRDAQEEGPDGAGGSGFPAISSGGRYVAFASENANLVEGDTNAEPDVFIRDRDTDADRVFDEAGAASTRLISLTDTGAPADAPSSWPVIGGRGRYVAFDSQAGNLVGDDTNGVSDIFVRDRLRSRTIRISVSSAGAEGNAGSYEPAISSSGRWIAFASEASRLVAGDTNRVQDVFVHDRDTDADGIFDEPGAVDTSRVSVSGRGGQGNGWSSSAAISADGRHVSFESDASTLTAGDDNRFTDVFIRDRRTARTTRASVSTRGASSDDDSRGHDISRSGRYVAFSTPAGNLVPGDTNGTADVFVRDRDTDRDGIFDETGAVRTRRASLSSTGAQGDAYSDLPSMSENGAFVGWRSEATNLSRSPDTNRSADLFLRANP